jgi:hypothetical protein
MKLSSVGFAFSGKASVVEVLNEQNYDEYFSTIGDSDLPIVMGPWISEVGFELLYWIPFLNRIVEAYRLDKRRIYIVSRGGVSSWYGDIASHYTDIFSLMSAESFKSKNRDREETAGRQKHMKVGALDVELIRAWQGRSKREKFWWIHPALMYKKFMPFWQRKSSISLIEANTRHLRIKANSIQSIEQKLPERYIAVKFYFSKALPAKGVHEKYVARLLRRLTAKNDVVLLNTDFDIDGHDDVLSGITGDVLTFSEFMTPENNLAIQSMLVGGSKAFLGTYGGFSYLSSYMGIPSTSLYASELKFLPVHLDVAQRAFRYLKFGTFDGVKVAKDHERVPGAEFSCMSMDSFDRLTDLL